MAVLCDYFSRFLAAPGGGTQREFVARGDVAARASLVVLSAVESKFAGRFCFFFGAGWRELNFVVFFLSGIYIYGVEVRGTRSVNNA